MAKTIKSSMREMTGAEMVIQALIDNQITELSKPIDNLRQELSEAITKIEDEGLVPAERGAIIALFSPNGGVGVSTTAVNLAVRLAEVEL